VQNLPVNRTLQFDSEGNIVGERIFRQFVERAEVTPYWRHKILLGGNYELRFINTRESVTPAQIGTTSRIVDPRSESRFQFTFTQPVLRDFGIAVNTAVIRQAEKSELIAEQQVLQVILDTIFATQQRYWELVFRIQDLAVKRESQKLAEDFLAENTVRVELGTLAPIELVQARTQVKMREGEVIVAESAVGQAEDLVKEILGLPDTVGDWQIQLRPTDSPLFEPITAIPVEAMVTAALQQRPDFVQSQLDIAIREIARQLARNQRLPRLDVVGRSSVSAFGESIAESIYDYKEGDGYDWALGLQFQYPLGNRQARNDFLRRDLELQQALVTQRRLIRTIIRDIRQGIREIETASKRVEVTRQATALARTQLEAEQEKFRLGLSTSFNVLEFQEDLAIARTDETRALSDYNVALARLDQLTGKMQYDDFATPKK
jgi:outer membrane protein TolC